jgi:hypothetical protein
MPIPGPGTAISMTTIATEFGGTVPHSLSEYYRGGGLVPNAPQNAAIPTSGTISMGNFYGATNRVAIPLTITGNTYNYDVFANRGPTYTAGISDITVTVNPGVTVGSTSTGAFAMLVPSGFNAGDTVTIVNNGVIQGMGGGGGTGGSVPSGSSSSSPGGPGAGGGSAISVSRPTVITNNGTVAGGGGGGGGGAGRYTVNPKGATRSGGGGGGGGAGFNGGAGGGGGTGFPTASNGSPGSAGTSPAGGAGGPSPSNPGGSGGGRGAAGTAGTPVSPSTLGGSGGGAGNYIVGNPFVTWPVTGTRQGGVA